MPELPATLTVWTIDAWTGELRNTAPAEHDELAWFDAEHVCGLAMVDERIRELVLDALGG